jgi:cell division protein FtsA
LAEVVEPRYEELLDLVKGELRRSGLEGVVAGGVVLTGGSSKMDGLIELAEGVFQIPVRLGVPQYTSGLTDLLRNPVYATGVGLLLFGQRNRVERKSESIQTGGTRAVWEKMRSWFQGNF